MNLSRVVELFNSHEEFRRFQESFVVTATRPLDAQPLRERAVQLARKHDGVTNESELRRTLADLAVSVDSECYPMIAPMCAYVAQILFRDVSNAIPADIRTRILEYDGPKFYFVGHTSFFDYMLTGELIRRLGMDTPVTHFAGSVTRGWISNWIKGFRALLLPMSFSPVQHKAYSWFSAALAERNETQVLLARTSRYTVRSRDGVLREPYVPHAVVSSVKAAGKALVIPVAISYAAIPEDRNLISPPFFPLLSMAPKSWSLLARLALGYGTSEKIFNHLHGAFGDVSVDLGAPFELTDDKSLTLQRISHRAIEEIAKHKMIHPSHLVAKAMQGQDRVNFTTLKQAAEKELDTTCEFFRTRYRKNPPLQGVIESDLPQAVRTGIRTLMQRGALKRSFFRRTYSPSNPALLRFYGYYGDRRIYPLSGRNTMTVVNAGVWGYTLALHIGANMVKKPELSEHSLILYDSREDLIEKLTMEGKHPWHFKDIALPRSVRPESDFLAAVGDTSLILLVTPSKYFYGALLKVLQSAPEGSDLVIATKGFVPETGLLPCQTARYEMERLGKRMRVSILSGANLAHEIVLGGAGVTQLACDSSQTFERLKPLIETPLFRVVYSGDVIGTTISAALKNVYAIGYGILEGSKKAPENFLATYSTLVTAEIRQFGMLLGATPETFDAESQVWMADLLATCRGGRSAKFGRDLAEMDEKSGKHKPARTLLDQYRKKRIAVEGFEAARYANRMASQRGFHPAILGEIYSLLHGGKQINVNDFMEKCLDALTHKTQHPVPSINRSRALRY